MKKRNLAGLSLGVSILFVGLSAAPAFAVVDYYSGARSCNSGYHAQNSSYHRSADTHFQYTGSWHSQWHPSIPGWGYSWSGANTQTFSNSYVEGPNAGEISSVTTTRCV